MDVAGDAVENLVTQFSSALDFYRELVQNSIDAGSSSVEVWTEFIPERSSGVIAIHIDDFGEGMNEEIIDDQLTTLFSSTKEDDLTKIGKFGIGFVSVFAIDPEAVLVLTGRGGEYWEVLFHADRSFTKGRVDTPVEGTQITLFIEGDRAEYRRLVADSIATLKHWCSHSEVEVSFEDRSDPTGEVVIVNEEFSVEGECRSRMHVEGTELVIAFSREPVWGFYNRGLALAVGRGKTELVPGRFHHIAFKIKSRYLEHTLSRETVMRDANYEKAMAILDRAATTILRPSLVEQLEALVARRAGSGWDLRAMDEYLRGLAYLLSEGDAALDDLAERRLLGTVDGKSATLVEVADAAEIDGRVYMAENATPLTDALVRQGTPVLLAGRSEGTSGTSGLEFSVVGRLVARFLHRRMSAGVLGFMREKFGVDLWERATRLLVSPADVLVAVELDAGPDPDAPRMVAAAQRVLQRAFDREVPQVVRPMSESLHTSSDVIDCRYGRLSCCTVQGRAGAEPLFVVGRKLAPLMSLPPPGLPTSVGGRKPEAAVNRAHPQFRALLSLYKHEPEMAAYCLAKDLLLSEDRLLERDLDLIEAARDEQRSLMGGGR